jgi:uncharacterized protein (DUF1330 family)
VASRNRTEVDAVIVELESHGAGGVNPSGEQLRELVTSDRDGPLQFVNLLRYHSLAEYPQDHELAGAGLTGEQAYLRYGAVAFEHVARRGGRLTLWNSVEQQIIGTGDWDHVAIMEYPDTRAFIDMVLDPDYAAVLVHRDAGLADTSVIVTRPLLPGA